MSTLEQSLSQLIQEGVVSEDDAVARSLYPQGHRDPPAVHRRRVGG
jgi:Tfp pilus assembly pilus retraction ATPase PilT